MGRPEGRAFYLEPGGNVSLPHHRQKLWACLTSFSARQHEGKFPVYAELRKGVLLCYDIVGETQKPNGLKISVREEMT